MKFNLTIILLVALLAATVCAGTLTDDVAKAVANNLGLNCLAEAVLSVENAVKDFQYYVKMCGVSIPIDVSFVIDDSNDLIRITTKIKNDNAVLCDNASYEEAEDSKKTPTALCAASIKNQMERLGSAITSTTADIDAAVENDACIAITMTNLKLSLQNMPKVITTCGTLAAP